VTTAAPSTAVTGLRPAQPTDGSRAATGRPEPLPRLPALRPGLLRSRALLGRTLFSGLLGLSLLVGAGTRADNFTGQVVAVLDGDTVEVLDAAQTRHRVRLAGIDAPEMEQPFGDRAKAYLLALAGGKRVEVLALERDAYGRDVGKLLADRREINLAMVREGHAWWYRTYAAEQSQVDRVLYEAAEAKARAGRIGLWQDPDPIAPWDWRRTHRETRRRGH